MMYVFVLKRRRILGEPMQQRKLTGTNLALRAEKKPYIIFIKCFANKCFANTFLRSTTWNILIALVVKGSSFACLCAVLLHLGLTHLWVKRVSHLMPDWLRIHLEVVQKHSCAGSVCNFLSLASQTHYCASHPNHNHMGPGAAMEFSHWQRNTLSVRHCRAAGLAGPELLLRSRPWMSLFKTPVTSYSTNSARWLYFISIICFLLRTHVDVQPCCVFWRELETASMWVFQTQKTNRGRAL